MPKINKVKLVKDLARQKIGRVKRTAVITPKKRKPPKHKVMLDPFEF